ncbi:MAG: DUF6686 family protein, partial [Bacteroidota bacterium]
MSHQIKTLAKNAYGSLCFCTHCKNYQLSFNNIHMHLNKIELKALRERVNEIDSEEIMEVYTQRANERLFPIETAQYNMVLLFSSVEILSLQSLLNFEKRRSIKFMKKSQLNELIKQPL